MRRLLILLISYQIDRTEFVLGTHVIYFDHKETSSDFHISYVFKIFSVNKSTYSLLYCENKFGRLNSFRLTTNKIIFQR